MVCMEKRCDAHGEFRALVEKDQAFYARLRGSTKGIYPGHFIDVTTRCNLNCPYCYYPCRESQDPSIERIVQEARCYPVPTYLTGGEPTLRKDLPDLLQRLQQHQGAAMPTNGIGLLDMDFLKAVLQRIGRYDDHIARIALSWHGALNEKVFRRVLENVRELNERISGPIFVLRELDELPSFLAIAKEYADCIDFARIHMATDIWDAQDHRQLFMSDILKYLAGHAKDHGVDFAWNADYSTYWMPARFGNVRLTLARWFTRHDIDLGYLPLNPTYRAKNGECTQLIYGFIINEAMQRGWIKGRRMDEQMAVKHG